MLVSSIVLWGPPGLRAVEFPLPGGPPKYYTITYETSPGMTVQGELVLSARGGAPFAVRVSGELKTGEGPPVAVEGLIYEEEEGDFRMYLEARQPDGRFAHFRFFPGGSGKVGLIVGDQPSPYQRLNATLADSDIGSFLFTQESYSGQATKVFDNCGGFSQSFAFMLEFDASGVVQVVERASRTYQIITLGHDGMFEATGSFTIPSIGQATGTFTGQVDGRAVTGVEVIFPAACLEREVRYNYSGNAAN